MGLREKVTIALVVIVLTQIACRHCMPRTSTKASLKRYLNDLKPVKNNPVSTPYTPSKVNKKLTLTFGKTAQNGKTSQNSLPKKSLHKTFNFPENEYPLDNFPRDPFHMEMNFNENNHVNTLQKARDLQSSAINDLKKERKIKRKLLSNKQANNENIYLKTNVATNPDPIRLLDSETFPEVQYPLNTMETWGTNYRNFLPLTLEKPFDGTGRNTFSSKILKQDIKQPFTRLTKAKASKFLQSYDKLKEEHRRTSTENSKRSNAGETGLNFTKTATCEKVSDDFITAGLLLNVPNNSTEIRKTLELATKTFPREENTSPLTEHPYYDTIPLPYKVIEDNENVCPAIDLKNYTKEFQDVDGRVMAQTLRLIEEILLSDDTISAVEPSNINNGIETNANTTDGTDAPASFSNFSKEIETDVNNCSDAPASSSFSKEIEKIENTGEYVDAPESSTGVNKETENNKNTVEYADTPAPFNNSSKEIENNEDTGDYNESPRSCSNLSREIETNANTTDCTDDPTPSNTFSKGIKINENAAEYTDTPAPSHNFSKEIENTENTAEYTDTPAPSNKFRKEIKNTENTADCTDAPGLSSNLSGEIETNGNTTDCSDGPAPSSKLSKEIEKNENIDKYSDILSNEDLPSASIDSAEASSVSPTKEKHISVDTSADIMPYQQPLLPETTTTDSGPLNVRMPLSSTEPTTCDAPTNTSNSDPSSATTKVNKVPGHTSIIIIPMNNDETTPDTPIIVYLPSTQSSSMPSQIVSSSHDNLVPNNQLYNALSNMAPVQNDNPSSTALVSELLNGISDSGSSLPMHETLPIISMCDNNENSPSSMRVKPISDILIHKSSTDDATSITPNCDENLSQKAVETDIFRVNPDTLPQTLNFEHPIFDFADSEITSLSHGPYNNAINNELPIIARETNSNLQISNTSIKDLSIPALNITSKHLHETTYRDTVLNDSFIQILNDVPTVTLDQDVSSEIPVDSLEILENTPSSELLLNLIAPTDKSVTTSLISKEISESTLLIDEIPTKHIETPTPELILTTEAPLPFSKTLSDPELYEKVPLTIVTDTVKHSAPQQADNTPISSPILNNTPETTDTSLKTELFKIRQILDKMLSSGIHIDSQAPPMGNTTSLKEDQSFSSIQITTAPLSHSPLSSISDEDSLPLVTQTLSPIQMPIDCQPSRMDAPLSTIQSPTASQTSQIDSTSLPIHTPTDSRRSRVDTIVSPIQMHTESQASRIDASMSPIQTHTVSQTSRVDATFSPIHTLTDSRPSRVDTMVSPIQSRTASQPSRMDATLSRIQTPIDIQPSRIDATISPVQTPIASQPLQMDAALLPIKTPTDSQPFRSDATLSPIHSPTDSQPSRVDTIASPIQTPISSQPSRIDATFSPIQTPSDSQRSRIDATLSSVQTPTASQSSRMDATFSPIQTPTDSQPYRSDAKMSPNQTPTFSQLSQMDATLSTIKTPTFSQPSRMNTIVSPIKSPIVSQPSQIDATFSHSQTPTVSQPSRMDAPFSTIQTPTNSQPSPMDATFSPVQTPTDSQSSQKNATLSPILDTDTLPIINNHPLSPTHTIADSVPVPVKDKTLSPFPITNTPIDSLHIEEHKALPITPIEDASKVTPLSPIDEMSLSKLLLEDNSCPHISTDEADPPTPVFDISIVNKPYLMDNLVTPVSEAVTASRIKDTPDNELPHAMEDLPLKMDLEFSTIYDVSLPLEDLPIKGHQKSSDSPLSIVDLPRHVDKPLNLLSEDAVSDVFTPTKVLSLPVEEVVEVTKLDIPTNNFTSFKCDSMDDVNQDFSLSKDSSYKFAALPRNELISQMHESVPYLPYVDGLYKEPFVTNDSPIADIDKIPEIPTAYTKVSPLVDDSSLSMEDDASPETLLDDISSAISVNDDKTLPLPDNPTGVSLSINKIPSKSNLPLTKALLQNVLSDIDKGVLTPQIVKALRPPPSEEDKTVYNVDEKSQFSETKENILTPVENNIPNAKHTDNLINNFLVPKITEDTPVTDFSKELPDQMDKDKPEAPIDSVEDRIKTEIKSSGNYINEQPIAKDRISLGNDIFKDFSRNEALFSSKEPKTKALLENVQSDINTNGFSLPVSKGHPATLFSVLDKSIDYIDSPDSENLPNTGHSEHQTETSVLFPEQTQGTLSLDEDRMLSETPNLDFYTATPIDHVEPDFKDDLTSPMAENLPLPSTSSSDPHFFPYNKGKTPSSSKLPITKALLENILSEFNTKGFSIAVSKPLPVTSSSVLDKARNYIDSPESVIIADTSPPMNTTDDSLLPVADILPNIAYFDHQSENNKPFPEGSEDPSPLENKLLSKIRSSDIYKEISSAIVQVEQEPNDNLTSLMAENLLLPSSSSTDQQLFTNIKGKIPSSSKLPITKALLENVLSEKSTKGLSIPVSKDIPATSSSALDKTLNFIDSLDSDTTGDKLPHSEATQDSPPLLVAEILPNVGPSDHKTDKKLPFPEQSENPLSLEEDKMLSEIPSIDISTAKLESSNFDLTSPMTEIHADPELSSNKNKTPYTSKLPIAKALLENVLSDINTKSFSLPAAKAVPVTPRLQLDKTLYYLEAPPSDTTKDSSLSVVPKENNPMSETNEKDTPTDKVGPESNHPILDIPINESPIDKMFNDKSDDLTEELGDSYETHNTDQPTYDTDSFKTDKMFNDDFTEEAEDTYETLSAEELTYNTDDFKTDKIFNDDMTEEVIKYWHETSSAVHLPTQTDKQDTVTDEILSDFPVIQTNQLFSSKLPVTKALLEIILADINDGAIASKHLLNHHNH